MSRDGLLFLQDMAQAAEKIGRYVDGLSFEAFCSNEQVFDAVLFNLQVLGEAAKNLPDAMRADMPEIAWSAMARFRDVIAHRYFALDARIVWDAAVNRVPEVHKAVSAYLVRVGVS